MPQSDPNEQKSARLHLGTASIRKDRRTRGKTLASKVPPGDHASLCVDREGIAPIAFLNEYNAGRVQELVPIRWGRMLRSPFTFFRGAAALMAADLARTPRTDLRVQACGDCHVLNFGAFATPERNIIFDINDFDETLPAPWEWDVKRLATSFSLLARNNGVPPTYVKDAAAAVARSYRLMTEKFAHMPIMDVWYSRIDWPSVIANTGDPSLAEARQARLRQAVDRTVREYYFPKLTEQRGGRFMIKDKPPIIYHPQDQLFADEFQRALPTYRDSLQEDKRRLFDRYQLEDVAIKVVGIGSVGTMCGVALFMAPDNEPLMLQIKEATASVLERYAGTSEYTNHGHRVVAGQRIAQSASDIFLGWTQFESGRHFYVRQLRDTKVKPEIDLWTGRDTVEAAELMGAVLARAHARSGDAAVVAGYLDGSEHFDEAIAEFAISYADQTERDYKCLQDAVRLGQLKAVIEENED